MINKIKNYTSFQKRKKIYIKQIDIFTNNFKIEDNVRLESNESVSKKVDTEGELSGFLNSASMDVVHFIIHGCSIKQNHLILHYITNTKFSEPLIWDPMLSPINQMYTKKINNPLFIFL